MQHPLRCSPVFLPFAGGAKSRFSFVRSAHRVKRIIFHIRSEAFPSDNSAAVAMVENDFIKSQQNFLRTLAAEVRVERMEDWYEIPFGRLDLFRRRNAKCSEETRHPLQQQSLDGGWQKKRAQLRSFLVKYEGSMQRALMESFPNFHWKPWLFKSVPRGLWNNERYCRQFVLDAEQRMPIRSREDWYKVKVQEMRAIGGAGLLNKFDFSLQKMLVELLPEFDWKPWLFERVTDGYWDVKDNRQQYFAWLSNELDIRTLDDWYKVTIEQVHAKGGQRTLVSLAFSLFCCRFLLFSPCSF